VTLGNAWSGAADSRRKVNGVERRSDEKQHQPGGESNGYGHGSEEHGGMHSLAEMLAGVLWIASIFAPCERRRNRQSRDIASRLSPVRHGWLSAERRMRSSLERPGRAGQIARDRPKRGAWSVPDNGWPVIPRDQLYFLEIGGSAYLAVVDSKLRGVLFWERDVEDECQTGEPEDTFMWLWVPADMPQHHVGLSVPPIRGAMTADERQANVDAAKDAVYWFMSGSPWGAAPKQTGSE
jgi:hypothetical protein